MRTISINAVTKEAASVLDFTKKLIDNTDNLESIHRRDGVSRIDALMGLLFSVGYKCEDRDIGKIREMRHELSDYYPS